MSQTLVWGDTPLQWRDVVKVARQGTTLALSDSAWQRIAQGREIVGNIVAAGQVAYGINTGLGALCNITLSDDELSQLSRNTLLSHACGVGPSLGKPEVRAILCAAIANYSHGKSGVSVVLVERLLALLNLQITPQVPSQGSVGYLTHMAHISLALMGVGEVEWEGHLMPAQQALERNGLAPFRPGAKEGLSLVNGTPCMTGLACLALDDAERLLDWADITGAMSFEALRGQLAAFDPEVLALKASPGIQRSGERLRRLLMDSAVLNESQGIRTQDALSLRAMPQVHGACRDQFDHAQRQVETELNACTDNPLVLGTPQAWRVISQANPHGESVAMACDVLAIALAELGSIAERRLDRLVNPLVSGLPPFLVAQPGVNSGMMIAQYVAASLCAENRQLAQPAVLDNYVTSGLQEDHLSLGTGSALKLLKLVSNVDHIIAIEYLLAAQALEFHGEARLASGTLHAWRRLRQSVASWQQDRWLAPDIARAVSEIKAHPVDAL
ncbi:histidine ammonia-lyase [Pantoea sp. AN62]|jgi:histidine ammonia-lyase|uniref:Histidine ammonia-lyase n=1 Tax=Pantoea brenneri TaxID=472694 RepID=A0AAX3JAZ0_9GAMM|nr:MULTISPECIES: histidine ammonia-lyase [Pantoea]KKD33857.1 histidine ammonia-lyase [Pantoea sp. 3.5.1]MBS6034975.1 histidine ammonia-lyase [Pantoea sp.]MDH2125016.1 histidine ammonia-lyase [Pantoea brenneri]MDU4125785.1 histidine ammonia-lyase [Pantoea sp.]MDU4744773.1 histidine ammonia-lyase [Pantoea sp.]